MSRPGTPIKRRRAAVRKTPRVARVQESASSGALMRIHAVSEQTGVPEPTLRAWERRYGLPTPERTAAGYRLYSADNVEQVRRMRSLCDDGVAAAEAARLVKGTAPLQPAGAGAVVGEDLHQRAVRALLDAIERFDEVGLAEEMRRFMVLGDSVTLLDRVIRPVLVEVGERWHRGELSIAHEHLASHALRGVLSDLLRLTPTGPAAPRALLACFEDEEHDLGLLGLALRLATWGIRPVMLGARTPPAALRNALASNGAALVALSVSLVPDRSRARRLVDDYAAACGDTPWIVGGAGASALGALITKRGGHVQPDDGLQLQSLAVRLARRGGR